MKKLKYTSATLVILSLLSPIPEAYSFNQEEKKEEQALAILLGKFTKARKILKKTPGPIKPGDIYVIQPGDSLEVIARKSYGNTGFRQELIREAIVNNNPDAFFRGNENYLFAGAKIKVPTIEDIKSIVFSSRKETSYRRTKSHWIRFP